MYVRAGPCVCEHCMEEEWDQCEIGGWDLKVIVPLGYRIPKEADLNQQLNESEEVEEENSWEILSIQRQRVVKGTGDAAIRKDNKCSICSYYCQVYKYTISIATL